jgi:hypothetical protein
MVKLSIEDLKKSENFKTKIRWEVSPRVFFDPIAAAGGDPDKAVDVTHGYMLYVDIMEDRPAIVVMQLKQIISKTVGYLHDAPVDLMEEAMNCPEDQKIQGMCPLTGGLVEWLKRELEIV